MSSRSPSIVDRQATIRPRDLVPPAQCGDTAVKIRNVLEQLPTAYRTALELRLIVGLSGDEAGEVIARSHGAFRSPLFRAIRNESNPILAVRIAFGTTRLLDQAARESGEPYGQ